MRLVFDADGLIKLHRAGALSRVVRAFPCAIPRAVFAEVVTRGKARLHQDAQEIEALLTGAVTILAVEQHEQSEPGLGAGELSVLGLNVHWLLFFFIVSLVAGYSLKGVFKVEV